MTREAGPVRGLYIHIPFCRAKCNYCDFYSVPLSTADCLEGYIKGLAAEIKQRALFYDNIPVSTVYWGGGTPSLLAPEHIHRVLSIIKENYPVQADLEISLEANPATVDTKQLQEFREAGINRLSLGIQSFRNEELSVLGRVHTDQDSRDAIQAAREAGIQNLSLDLIYGLPGQTRDDWLFNLQSALEQEPEHISLYLLQLEPHTPLGRKVERKEIFLLDEDLELEMYRLSQQIISQAGYQQYEISNFARTGYECRHNLLYWDSCEYLGFGAGAVSFLSSRRERNTEDISKYISHADQTDFWQGEVLEEMDREQRWVDALLLGLRKTRGIHLQAFNERFGIDILAEYPEVIDDLVGGKFLEITHGYLRMTPSAYFISNQILCRFIA